MPPAKCSFPGPPVTRSVSPDDIEAYLKTRGYLPALSVETGWPRGIAYMGWPPRWPDPRALMIPIIPRMVMGTRLCSHPLEPIVETIVQNERRTPGEVLREISVMALIADGE
ncbi:hypothetical protein WMF28_09230 [Sorangium sp. So ce590]|uniref:hypothetical protein n=1 Tax=Sorangium sp. So ce590 TaxID=3133317 RepID=UPI003F643EF3